MPIDSPHPHYTERLLQWEKCRHTIAGADALRRHTTTYLPLLEGHRDHGDPAYRSYLHRAGFYNASGRTVQGMSGAIFRRDPTFTKIPKDVEALFPDITGQARALDGIAADVFEEDLKVGRAGILVEMPPAGAADMRPYWVIWKAEQILNWRTDVVNGKQRLVFVVLKEHVSTPKPGDPFISDETIQYRELRLNDAGEYEQVIWTKAADGQQHVPGPPTLIVRTGVPLTFIPFVFINASHTDPHLEEPPLLDLVEENLSHYRSSADYEHGAHFTALPMIVIVGAPPNATIEVGSGKALILDNQPYSKAEMLEFKGQGLGAIERVIDRKEKRMAVLGARLLEQQPTLMDTATAARLRQQGDESVMTRLANTVSAGLTKALQWTIWWMSSAAITDASVQDAKIALNTDLIETKLDAHRLTGLVGAYQAGGMSLNTLIYNFTQGELMPPGRTVEEEIALIVSDEQRRLADPTVHLPSAGSGQTAEVV